MRDLVVIKLGGSVITEKNRAVGVLRKAVSQRLCKEIVEAKKKKNFDLVICHGAGSFGHPLAKKYNLSDGYKNKKSLNGVVFTKLSVRKLNLEIVRIIVESGINASVVDTSSICETENKRIKSFDTKIVKNLIGLKITPVLFGDVVFDSKQGFAIISADQIAVHLGEKLNAKRIIFVSDVDGVFDKNPGNHKNAKLIAEINKTNYLKIFENYELSGRSDVSGEMRGKIQEIMENKGKIDVRVVNGFKKNNLLRILIGKNIGTHVIR